MAPSERIVLFGNLSNIAKQFTTRALFLLFQVLIDVETYEYFSVHSKGSEGVLVLVQHYRDIPLMRKESFVLGPGSGKRVKLPRSRSSCPVLQKLSLSKGPCFDAMQTRYMVIQTRDTCFVHYV